MPIDDQKIGDPLYSLAKMLDARAVDINCGHAHANEEHNVRRSMVLILSEISEMLLEEAKRY